MPFLSQFARQTTWAVGGNMILTFLKKGLGVGYIKRSVWGLINNLNWTGWPQSLTSHYLGIVKNVIREHLNLLFIAQQLSRQNDDSYRYNGKLNLFWMTQLLCGERIISDENATLNLLGWWYGSWENFFHEKWNRGFSFSLVQISN